jgi:hypothetical protein
MYYWNASLTALHIFSFKRLVTAHNTNIDICIKYRNLVFFLKLDKSTELEKIIFFFWFSSVLRTQESCRS